MEYVQLGNSSLKVSKACLGCMGFGEASEGMHKWTLGLEDTKKIIKYALDQGINFFDTAMAYQGGSSEVFLGKAIKEYAIREEVVIATKYIPRTSEMIEKGISAKEWITTCLNNSLQRLDMDYIDLYILHMWDYDTPILETLTILNEFIQEGKVREIGVSNCFAYQIAIANEIAKQNGLKGFVSVQNHYNLLFREEEREMARYCKLENIAMAPYSALAAGRLSKRPGETSLRLEKDQYAKGKYEKAQDQDLPIIQRVVELADKRGCSMTEISLAYLYTKVTSPIVGATKPYHIDGMVNACNIHLTNEEIHYLEELYTPHQLVGVLANAR